MNIKPFKLAACDPRAKLWWPELATIEDLAHKALCLSFQQLSFANFTGMKIDASDLGVNAADA